MKALLLILLCSQLSIIILTCENGCGTNEICISQKCVCDNGWFGPSCNLYADQLQAGVMTSKNISEDAWSYFYYPFKEIDQNKNIKILIEADFNFLEVYSLFNEEGGFEMPSIQFNKRILFSNNSKTQIIYFSEEEIPFGNYGKLVLGFKNSDHLNKRVNIQLNLEGRHIIEGGNFSSARKLKIVIGVSVAVVVFIIRLLFELWKRKKISLPKPRRNNQATQNRAGNIEEQNPHTQIEIKLSKEYIDQYFPRNKFCDLKSSFPQSICPICLEEFQNDDECRQLYCEHIYHDNCIELCLAKYDNCPECRKPMRKEAIQEFFNKRELKGKLDNQVEKPPEVIVHCAK